VGDEAVPRTDGGFRVTSLSARALYDRASLETLHTSATRPPLWGVRSGPRIPSCRSAAIPPPAATSACLRAGQDRRSCRP
jgi:hypothetical protein